MINGTMSLKCAKIEWIDEFKLLLSNNWGGGQSGKRVVQQFKRRQNGIPQNMVVLVITFNEWKSSQN